MLAQMLDYRLQLLLRQLRKPTHAAEEAQTGSQIPDASTPPSLWPRALRQEAWRLTELMLDDLHDSVEAAGRRFAILYVPVHAQLKGTLNETQTWKPSLFRYAEERGVRLLDPTAAFLEKTAADIAMYDDHWTPAGHEVVADILTKWLFENP